MKLKHIIIDNIEIPILIKDNGFEDTIIYIHGLNSSTDALNEVVKMDLNFNIIAINYPGNKYLVNYSANFDKYIEITKKLLAKVKSKRIHLLGHSLGGAIAAHVARFPIIDKQFYVSALVPYDYEKPFVKFTKVFLENPSVYNGFIKFASKITDMNIHLNEGLVEMLEKVSEYTETSRRLMVEYVLNPIEIEKLRIAYFSTNPKKTHFIIGDHDKVVKVDEFSNFVENELKRKAIVLKGCDHNPFTYNTQKVIDYINQNIKPIKRKDDGPILLSVI